MNHPKISLGCVANLFSRQMTFEKAGDMEQGHAHNFDHLTLLAHGKLRVRIHENVTDFEAPAMIYIKADIEHELTALEDGTVAYCIHALREKDGSGDIIAPDMIPAGANPFEYAQKTTCVSC